MTEKDQAEYIEACATKSRYEAILIRTEQVTKKEIGASVIDYVCAMNQERKDTDKPWQKAITGSRRASFSCGGGNKSGSPKGDALLTRAEAAEKSGANLRDIDRVNKVYKYQKKNPCPQLIEALESNESKK